MLSQSCGLVKRAGTYFAHICRKCCATSRKYRWKIVHPVGACPARSLPPYPFYDSIRRGGIHPSRAPPPLQTATAARGLAALHPHIKPVRRAGCPHPAETYRHIPFPHRHPVGAGHARPAAYRQILFTIQSVGEEFIPPGHPPTAANGHGGQRAGRPTPPHQTRA